MKAQAPLTKTQAFFSVFASSLLLVAAAAPAQSLPQILPEIPAVSPLRPIDVDYHEFLKSRPRGNRSFESSALTGTVSTKRGPITDIDINEIPEVSADQLGKAFTYIRDTTLLKDEEQHQRRLTWLYPDDGCFARAQLASQLSLQIFAARPAKLFVYGNLRVKTPNHPKGLIGWWYHVAPVVKVATQIYVIDPSIDPSQALKFEDWTSDMGADEKEFALCKPSAYNPDSACDAPEDPKLDGLALSDEAPLLRNERDRLVQLGRNPDEELGAHPPWTKTP